LGHALSYRGAWQEAEAIHEKGIELARKQNNKQIECVIMAFSAHRAFLMENYPLAIEKGEIAKQLADIPFPGIGILPRDQISAAWILGSAYRANNELTLAEENLSKALNLCRQINLVEMEADILLDLARLSFDYGLRQAQPSASQKNTGTSQDKYFKDAQEKASEALTITERSGYVLQGADVHLFLAELALTPAPSRSTPVGLPVGEGDPKGRVREQKELALRHAKEALKLATCDGPPYYYKVAYEEAEQFLKQLGG
jgi:tetratricopeptide (TPR) repeat protein